MPQTVHCLSIDDVAIQAAEVVRDNAFLTQLADVLATNGDNIYSLEEFSAMPVDPSYSPQLPLAYKSCSWDRPSLLLKTK